MMRMTKGSNQHAEDMRREPSRMEDSQSRGTTKNTRIAHVLGQIPALNWRNNQDIQQCWWNYTMYDDWGSQRTRIMQKRTKDKRRSYDNRWLLSQIGVSNSMRNMGNWSPRAFGNDCWSQWNCTVICDPSELRTRPQWLINVGNYSL